MKNQFDVQNPKVRRDYAPAIRFVPPASSPSGMGIGRVEIRAEEIDNSCVVKLLGRRTFEQRQLYYQRGTVDHMGGSLIVISLQCTC